MTPNTRLAVTLRDAVSSDTTALCEIWSGVIRRADPAQQLADLEQVVAQAEERDDTRVLVAEYDGQVVGAVYLRVDTVTPINFEPVLLTVSPHVLPGFRRHGVGRALLDAAVEWAEELGIGYVASAATAGSRDANRFLARLALAPTAMLRVAPTSVVRSKLSARGPARSRSRARVLSARRTQRAAGNA